MKLYQPSNPHPRDLSPSRSGRSGFLPSVLAGICLLAPFQTGKAQIISQYIETNSGSVPKGVEIWNPTGATLDFSVTPLVIEKGTNGGAPAADVTVSSGTLAAGAVMVIGTPEMGTYLTDQGLSSVTFVSKAFTFNGDDGLVVKLDGVVKDVFGTVGVDPGSAWTGSSVSTANQNIQLLGGISTGDTDGWTDPSTRFETVSSDPATLPAGLAGFGVAPALVADTTAPVISSRTPGIAATDISINTSISITFDESVQAGAGTVQLFKEAGASDVAIPIGAVGVAGAVVSFTPAAPLEDSTTYYVLIDATAFTDFASPTPNGFPGISLESEWTFTTAAPDVTAPTATLTPLDDSSDFLPAANIVLTFDEDVKVGTGVLSLKKTIGDVPVEEFDSSDLNVDIVGGVVTLNPTLLLDPNTSYYIEAPVGWVTDFASTPNPSPAITGTSAWNFTTRALSAVVINQYYEGTGTDRFIELKNLTGSDIILDGYRLSTWSSSGVAGNQGWKEGEFAYTDREFFMDGITIPANDYLLIANTGAVSPGYAVISANQKNATADPVTFFSGTASIVLYNGATNALANVVDAISITASEGTDTSFYRLTNTPAFNFDVGSSVIDDLGQAWEEIDIALVNAATSGDPFYLQANILSVPPVLDLFTVGADTASIVTPTATLDFEWSGGVPTEYIVSELSDFSDTDWVTLPGTAPVYAPSAGNGVKTIYFKLRNANGESDVVSDTITRSAYVTPSSILITQYYEGSSNNKYVEITNTTEAPIDLDGWSLVRWTNADAENWKITGLATGGTVIALSGPLAAGETAVFANSSAASPIPAASAFFSSGNFNHTGNDSYGLYEGEVTPENLRDAASFTALNEGANTSFVRISTGLGFDFAPETSLLDFATVWEQVATGDVDSATTGALDLNEALGVYPGTPPTGYGAWADTFVESQTADFDYDGDGIDNGTEYFMGTDPAAFTANPGLVAGSVTWPRASGTTITSFLVEVSTNLTDWEDASVNYGANLTISASEVSFTPPTGAGSFFVRLSVTP